MHKNHPKVCNAYELDKLCRFGSDLLYHHHLIGCESQDEKPKRILYLEKLSENMAEKVNQKLNKSKERNIRLPKKLTNWTI